MALQATLARASPAAPCIIAVARVLPEALREVPLYSRYVDDAHVAVPTTSLPLQPYPTMGQRLSYCLHVLPHGGCLATVGCAGWSRSTRYPRSPSG